MDVVWLKMPYPGIRSGLALTKHMYICYMHGTDKRVLKVQSYKPHHIDKMPCRNYLVEKPDVKRNPFSKTSIIDLDKGFLLSQVEIDKCLKAKRRISIELLLELTKKTKSFESLRITPISRSDLVRLNPAVRLLS
jgi:hypothetical protein